MNDFSNPSKEQLRQKAALFPQSPGVYQFLDEQNLVLYVGKAKNLKDRVSSYFQKDPERMLSQILCKAIRDIRFITTPCEQQALFLEHKLIQNHNPPFNTRLRYAGFPFPYIKLVSKKSKLFLFKTRNYMPEIGTYFGPYADVTIATNLVQLLHYLLPIDPKSFYHQDRTQHMSIVSLRRRITNFLHASDQKLVQKLRILMHRAGKSEKFTIASICKNLVTRLQVKIAAISAPSDLHPHQEISLFCQDVVNFHACESGILLCVLRMNQETILYKFSSFFPLPKSVATKFCQTTLLDNGCKTNLLLALQQLYSHQNPSHRISHILFPFNNLETTSQEYTVALQSLLAQIARPQNLPPIIVYTPHFSQEKLLLAKGEAKSIFFSHRGSINLGGTHLESVQEILSLSQRPSIIDAFDIANTEDQHIMGGVVRFVEGYPDKSQYRVFNIRGTTFRNDFYSIYETVSRRYTQCVRDKKPFPQLILIDGGKGQLSFAYRALQQLQLETVIPLVSLAKKEENLYVIDTPVPLDIKKDHPGLLFLMSIRDEAHHFINTKHRKKRDSWTS